MVAVGDAAAAELALDDARWKCAIRRCWLSPGRPADRAKARSRSARSMIADRHEEPRPDAASGCRSASRQPPHASDLPPAERVLLDLARGRSCCAGTPKFFRRSRQAAGRRPRSPARSAGVRRRRRRRRCRPVHRRPGLGAPPRWPRPDPVTALRSSTKSSGQSATPDGTARRHQRQVLDRDCAAPARCRAAQLGRGDRGCRRPRRWRRRRCRRSRRPGG